MSSLGGMPSTVQKLEKAIEGMIGEVSRTHIVPMQKDAFQCCARCCDTSADDMQRLQQCVERCSSGPQQAQKVIHASMHEFQERFQRCAHRCQDLARDGMSYDATAKEQERAQGKFDSCMNECGTEFLERIPKLKADVLQELKRL